MEKIKAFATTAVFAILIWFAADLNVSRAQKFQITVRLRGGDPDTYAAFDVPSSQVTFDVWVYGRRLYLHDFGELTRDHVLEASLSSKPGSKLTETRSSTAILTSIREIASIPVTIQDVRPATVPIVIDSFVTVSNVTVVPTFGDLEVTSQPLPKVSVKLPKFAERRYLADLTLQPSAEELIRKQLRAGAEGATFRIQLPLTLAANPSIPCTFTPKEVLFEGVVEEQTGTQPFGPVIVKFLIPHDVQRRYAVAAREGTNFRPDVYVTGPKTQLDQLDVHDIVGFVEVKAEYTFKPQKEYDRLIRFVLPPELPGLTVAPVSQDLRISFKLVERSDYPAAAP